MRSIEQMPRTFGQCPNYRDLLVGIEYVCHTYYCITQIEGRQLFLCYNFVAMKSLTLALLVLAFFPQNPSHSAKDVQQHPDGGQEIGDSSIAIVKVPAAPKPTDADSADKAAAHKDEPVRVAQPIAITTRPDYAAWVFSALLVGVGGFQAYLLFKTMRAIQQQAVQMERQTGILEKNTAAAEANAEAAKANAEATKKSIEIMVSKERARVRVEVSPFDLESNAVLGIKTVSFKVFSYGQTAAFIYSSAEWVEIDESPEYVRDTVFPPIGIPAVLHPSQEGYETTALLFTTLNDLHVDRIYRGKLFVHFQGYIKYRDVFGIEHETRFRYKWVPGLPPGSPGVSVKYWTEVGGKESNYET